MIYSYFSTRRIKKLTPTIAAAVESDKDKTSSRDRGRMTHLRWCLKSRSLRPPPKKEIIIIIIIISPRAPHHRKANTPSLCTTLLLTWYHRANYLKKKKPSQAVDSIPSLNQPREVTSTRADCDRCYVVGASKNRQLVAAAAARCRCTQSSSASSQPEAFIARQEAVTTRLGCRRVGAGRPSRQVCYPGRGYLTPVKHRYTASLFVALLNV